MSKMSKTYKQVILCLLLFVFPISADDFKLPRINVEKPEGKVQAGEVVWVNFNTDAADHLQKTTWLLDVKSMVKEKGVIVEKTKSHKFNPLTGELIFGAGITSGKVKVCVQASYLFLKIDKDKDGKITGVKADNLLSAKSTFYVEVEGVNPPDPEPDPDNPTKTEVWGPMPTLDPGKFGLSSKSFGWIVGSNWSSKKSDVKKCAEAIATNFDTTLSAVGAGAYDAVLKADFAEGFKKINMDLKAKNDATELQFRQAIQWGPFFNQLGDYTFSLYNNNQAISTRDDISRVLSETSAGLKALTVLTK
jgi:hypothetical protein